MLLGVNGETVEANASNGYFFRYDNDMLNGVYVDMGQRFLFISQHYPAYEEVAAGGRQEGFEEVHHGSPDLEEAPHAWVVGSIGKLVVCVAEGTARGEC